MRRRRPLRRRRTVRYRADRRAVAALEVAAGPLADRGVSVAFDADPAGRQAALRAYPLLRAAGAWPTAASLPDGQDPASLAQYRGPAALRAALDAAVPLADLVVDERLARWTGRLHWAEGQIGAARDAAGLIATFPSEHVGRQVLRVARQLGLEPAEVTGVVVDTVRRDTDAPGRLSGRDRRDDLDRGQGADAAPITGAQRRAAGPRRLPRPASHLSPKGRRRRPGRTGRQCRTASRAAPGWPQPVAASPWAPGARRTVSVADGSHANLRTRSLAARGAYSGGTGSGSVGEGPRGGHGGSTGVIGSGGSGSGGGAGVGSVIWTSVVRGRSPMSVRFRQPYDQ